MKKLKNDKGGFTLVELMIVVVILGILVAIAVPIFNSVTANAREKACHNNIDTIEKAGTQFLMARTDGNLFPIFTANASGGSTRSEVITTQADAQSKLSSDFLIFFDSGELPLCEEHSYTIEISSANDDYSISVTCSEHGRKIS